MKKFLFSSITVLLLFGCAAPEKKMETLFYPPLPQVPRIQFLTGFTTESDIGKKQSAFREFIVGKEGGLKAIGRPYDIAAGTDKIYVSDRELKKVIVVDLKNKEFDYLKSSRGGNYTEPGGIWVSDDNLIYITDFAKRKVYVFDGNGEYVRMYGKQEQMDKPLDVAVFENKIYVSDFNKHQIIVLDKGTGETIQEIGELGNAEGQFFKPTFISLDQDGYLFVNDAFNFRVQKFKPNGEFDRIIGYHGDTIGGFARPKGLDIDNEAHLYAVDTAFENVQIFDTNNGDVLLFFGGFTEQTGGMYLPNGLWVDYENAHYFSEYADKDFRLKYVIYVGNMLGGDKINVYGFGEWIGEPLEGM